MPSNIYPREKYGVAVDALKGSGGIRERLWEAYGSFHPVNQGHFGDPKLSKKHEAIIAALTAHKEPKLDIGHVQYTLSRISDEEAMKISDMIIELNIGLR